MTRDFFKQVMNINDKTNQMVTFRFPGDFQWHDKNEIKNTQSMSSSFDHLMNFINQCNLYQWLPKYDQIIADFIDSNLELFKFNDTLRIMLPDILKYQFFDWKTNCWDDEYDCDPNDESYEPSEEQFGDEEDSNVVNQQSSSRMCYVFNCQLTSCNFLFCCSLFLLDMKQFIFKL